MYMYVIYAFLVQIVQFCLKMNLRVEIFLINLISTIVGNPFVFVCLIVLLGFFGSSLYILTALVINLQSGIHIMSGVYSLKTAHSHYPS